MNNVRLVCGNVSVDLPSDFGILINKSIADIREPESRSSDWSKTFTLPGTKANNKLFTHLFDLNLSIRNTSATNFSPDFNPNLKADAILQVDEVTQIEGFIRLLSIKVNDFNQIEYECSMHGQLADLFAKVADAKLGSLDFTEYNHTINSTNIFNSWNTSIIKNGSTYVNFSGGAPTGEGYVYGWMDNGAYSNYQTLYTDNMTPYIYAKTIVDKIFSGAGYTYTSGSFFNTAQFKRLVIPCPTKSPTLSETDIQNRQFEAKASGTTTYGQGGQYNFPIEVFDPSNQYNPTTSNFVNGFFNQKYDLNFYMNGSAANLQPSVTNTIRFRLFINNKFFKEVVIYKVADASGNTTFDDTIVFEGVRLQKNDAVTIRPGFIRDNLSAIINAATTTVNSTSKFYNTIVESSYAYDDTMDFSGFFTNSEVKQREFMRWIFSMFNLYAEADADMTKKLVIMPREEFFTSNVRDWTSKRDLSQPLEIIPMGELDAGKYLFTYAEGDDDQNKYYTEDYARTYGDRPIVVNNDFLKDEKKIEIGFAPTLIAKTQNEDKYLPSMETNAQDFKTGKLRILQYKYKTCLPYVVINGNPGLTVGTTTTKSNYPFMGHLDDPTASTSDINFGMPRFIGVAPGTAITNNNLYNAYWSKYISEITDKDSKIVRGSFYLTPADMEKLSFRDLYFFDGNYFRLNKVDDYDPINPSVNICEFLFLKTGQTFASTTGTIGGGGSQSSGRNEEYNPGGGNVQGKVIENKGISLGYFNNVGDGIMVGNGLTNYGQRNAGFATSGVTFLCDDSIVIGVAPAVPVSCNEVWIQGQQFNPNNFSTNRIIFTAATSVTASLNYDIYIMSLTANTTLNLPDATTCLGKAYYVYKDSSGHVLRVDPFETQTIDDVTHYDLTTHYECIQIVSDGTQWRVISKK